MDWAEFLAARLDEREALARDRLCVNCGERTEPVGGPLGVTGYTHYGRPAAGQVQGWQGRRCPGRITGAEPAQDPSWVLADVASKRAVLAELQRRRDSLAAYPNAANVMGLSAIETTVRLLCEPWSGHPDYPGKAVSSLA